MLTILFLFYSTNTVFVYLFQASKHVLLTLGNYRHYLKKCLRGQPNLLPGSTKLNALDFRNKIFEKK